jgi:hypothetical protein
MTQLTRSIKRAFSWRLWLRGLIGAIVGAGANAITLMITDPNSYNIFATEDLMKLKQFCVGSALISAALYIKSHPITNKPYDSDYEDSSS